MVRVRHFVLGKSPRWQQPPLYFSSEPHHVPILICVLSVCRPGIHHLTVSRDWLITSPRTCSRNRLQGPFVDQPTLSTSTAEPTLRMVVRCADCGDGCCSFLPLRWQIPAWPTPVANLEYCYSYRSPSDCHCIQEGAAVRLRYILSPLHFFPSRFVPAAVDRLYVVPFVCLQSPPGTDLQRNLERNPANSDHRSLPPPSDE